jgi:thiamine-monophosphate kinase
MLDARAVPSAIGVADVEEWAGATGLALSGGDDYELCIAVPADAVDALTRAIAPTPLTVIGRFVEGSGVQVSGADLPDAAGWDSFR